MSKKIPFERTSTSEMSFLEASVRGFVIGHAILCISTARSFIKDRGHQRLERMMIPKAIEGPGIRLMSPLLGSSYLCVGALNFLAASIFNFDDCCYTLIGSGLGLHVNMAVIRSNLNEYLSTMYKPAALKRTCRIQFGIGGMCCLVGLVGLVQNKRPFKGDGWKW
jgi:hypothetical protein